jgi:hypothetical protein
MMTTLAIDAFALVLCIVMQQLMIAKLASRISQLERQVRTP